MLCSVTAVPALPVWFLTGRAKELPVEGEKAALHCAGKGIPVSDSKNKGWIFGTQPFGRVQVPAETGLRSLGTDLPFCSPSEECSPFMKIPTSFLQPNTEVPLPSICRRVFLSWAGKTRHGLQRSPFHFCNPTTYSFHTPLPHHTLMHGGEGRTFGRPQQLSGEVGRKDQMITGCLAIGHKV